MAAAKTTFQPSKRALTTLSNFGLSSMDVTAMGLTSNDLLEMGVANVKDRIAILSNSKNRDASSSSTKLQTQDFAFTASHVNSTRQWGKCLNIIVKYRYIGNETIDYREIYSRALVYAEPLSTPSKDIPMDAKWEVVNNAFVKETMATYSSQIASMSSMIQVRSQSNADIDEPGNHGSVVTVGSLTPLAEPWVNSFSYDCTKYTGPNAPVDDWQ